MSEPIPLKILLVGDAASEKSEILLQYTLMRIFPTTKCLE